MIQILEIKKIGSDFLYKFLLVVNEYSYIYTSFIYR